MSKSKPGPKRKLPKRRDPMAPLLHDNELPFGPKVERDRSKWSKRDRRKDRDYDDED